MLKIIVCGDNQLRVRQGIHLFSPDTHAFEGAMNDAERDGFEFIFAHFHCVDGLYSIPAETLAWLFTQARDGLGFGLTVTVTKPECPVCNGTGTYLRTQFSTGQPVAERCMQCNGGRQ